MNLMEFRKSFFLNTLVILLLLSVLLIACGNQPTTKTSFQRTPSKTAIPTDFRIRNITPIYSRTPTHSLKSPKTVTIFPTSDSTQQTWLATALAIKSTSDAWYQQKEKIKETQISTFSADCDQLNIYASEISSDGKWFASSCGYNHDQLLSVRNLEGTVWNFEYKDFVSTDLVDTLGMVRPEFWSPDGNFLYFTLGVGYSGGGNYCFPKDFGDYGLFRIKLKTGEWSTVIPFDGAFPGDEIEFSPDGRYLAITNHGVLITNMTSGKAIRIMTSDQLERMVWSPNSRYLAYFTASCDDTSVLSSTVYIWDSLSNEKHVVFKKDGIILKPESWSDNSRLRIIGEEIIELDVLFTIFVHDIDLDKVETIGTATPNP